MSKDSGLDEAYPNTILQLFPTRTPRGPFRHTFITLDGVMQAPGGPEEEPTGGFKYGGWSVNYWDEMMAKVMMDEMMAKPFDLLLGRMTYDIFAAHWPYVNNDPDKLNAMAADKLNSARKYVVSKTHAKANWQNSTLITGDAVTEIMELKKQDGPEIQVHGSGNRQLNLRKGWRQTRQALLSNRIAFAAVRQSYGFLVLTLALSALLF